MKKIFLLVLMLVMICIPLIGKTSDNAMLFNGKTIKQLTIEEINAELLIRLFLTENEKKKHTLQDAFLKDILAVDRGKLPSRDYMHTLRITSVLKEKLRNESFGNNQSKYHLKRIRALEKFEKELKKKYVALDGPFTKFENKIEMNLGKAMWDSMLKESAPGSDIQTVRVKGLAKLIFGEAKKQREFGEYKIAVIDMKQDGVSVPNALCLPGGYVFVTTALIELLGSDDDALAFVIGHECGHHISKDSIQKLKLMLPLLPLKLISKKLVARFIEAPMSRKDEYKADRKGCELNKKSGLNPIGGVTMMKKLTEAYGDHPAGPYATHPANADRVKNILKWIEKNK